MTARGDRPALSASELTPSVRKRLAELRGTKTLRVRKTATLSKDRIRGHALRVLAVIADLTQAERRRVLAHAARVNEL